MKRSLYPMLILSLNTVSLASAPAPGAAGSGSHTPLAGNSAAKGQAKAAQMLASKTKTATGSASAAAPRSVRAVPKANAAVEQAANTAAKKRDEEDQPLSEEEREFRGTILSLKDSFDNEDCRTMRAQIEKAYLEGLKQSPEGSAANEVTAITQQFGFALSSALALASRDTIDAQTERAVLKNYLFVTMARVEKLEKSLQEVLALLNVNPKLTAAIQDKKRRKSF